MIIDGYYPLYCSSVSGLSSLKIRAIRRPALQMYNIVNNFYLILNYDKKIKSAFYIFELMGKYQISATKYRPKSFEEVVGQDAVTNTLENAINKGKLGQALLFSGPRGVGKTTCARILAKKINLNQENNTDYSFNIFELDAASNNGVEHMRNLNEKVRVPPRIGNYKIYIIDEAHMLSKDAFNAFLKTLEEPPEHVVFILATTEKSKILPTVLSRCQIFDFKRISVIDIKKRLESVVLAQKIKYDDEALFLIAECSDGSLRDGLQILDRMINFCDEDINIDKVSKNLNIIGSEVYLGICDNIIEKNISKVLVAFDKIISNGFSEIDFIIGLSNHFRNLFFCKNENTLKLIETSEKLKNFYFNQSKKVDLYWIRKALKITNSFEINLKNIDNKRIHAEVCLMQISYIGEKKNIRNKKSLNNLEKSQTDYTNRIKSEDSTLKNHPEVEDVKKEVIEQKSSKLGLEIKEVSSFSLASVEKKKTFRERKISNDLSKSKITSYKNDFTQEELESCWNNYHNIKIQNREFNVASLLKISKPKKLDNNIGYTVPSDINKKELGDELPKLLDYMKISLKNDSIQIKVNSNISIKKNVIYSPSEKFEKLVELNPSLEKLRKKLDLDY